jgi:hypothetical protein
VSDECDCGACAEPTHYGDAEIPECDPTLLLTTALRGHVRYAYHDLQRHALVLRYRDGREVLIGGEPGDVWESRVGTVQ